MAIAAAKRRHSPKRQRNAWLLHAALVVLSALFIFPLFWMVSTSLKPIEETMKQPPTFVPADPAWAKLHGSFPSRVAQYVPQVPHYVRYVPRWRNYRDAFTYGRETLHYIPFLVYGRNTLLLCILTVAGTVISNAIVAYAFARMRWPGRDLAFAITLATMMVPFPVLMVPMYSLFRTLGWIGTFRPLWVPAWFGGAFNIFLLRQFFRTIPFELSEAARIDGCSEWATFRQIVLPLAKPALAVVALFTFMGTWRDFLGPLIYLLDQKTFTLSLGLQFYQSQHGGTQWHYLMAASTIVVAPVIVLFFFTQRQFIQGIALTGIKG